MKIVRKKILPQYFQPVIAGEKNFELRKDEDDIQPGESAYFARMGRELHGAGGTLPRKICSP